MEGIRKRLLSRLPGTPGGSQKCQAMKSIRPKDPRRAGKAANSAQDDSSTISMALMQE
jgi:hypothetical protein